MKMKISSIMLLLALFVTSCTNNTHRAYKVHVYKTHPSGTTTDQSNNSSSSSSNDAWVFWYVMYMTSSNNQTYYYTYSSPTSISSSQLSRVSWERNEKLPFEEQEAIKQPEELVNTEELPEEIQSVIAEEPASDQTVAEATTDESGATVVESSSSSPNEEPTTTEPSESAPSESSSGDSGGGGDGGGSGD